MGLDRYLNVMDFRRVAKKRLPAPIFHYIDGGADDEWSLRNNTDAFERYELLPSQLSDISHIDTRTQVLGQEIATPFFLSPTGMTRLFHADKEIGVARAAGNMGTYYSLSTLGTTSMADIAKVNSGPKMYQVYMLKDRELTKDFVSMAKEAGFTALCLTVDTLTAGNREREVKYGMRFPPKPMLRSLLSFMASPRWCAGLLKDHDFRMANVIHRVKAGTMGLIDYVNSQFDRSLTWDDAAWLADLWGGPFAIKGIQSAQDAVRAKACGASAIMISNHGGRQLGAAPAPVDCVRPMRDAIGGDLELIVDGGVRRGTHVLKALALGANAVSFGRPYLYALAAHGERGVQQALALMQAEVERSMALMGVAKIADIRPEHIRPVAAQMGQPR